LSSTQLVTDENGDQVARFIYGAWGEELYASESVPGILENRFVGGLGCRKDAATGLIYMRHRWYDPALQRFISRDPIGLKGGANFYKYARNNPARFLDVMGLEPSVTSTSEMPGYPEDWRTGTQRDGVEAYWNNATRESQRETGNYDVKLTLPDTHVNFTYDLPDIDIDASDYGKRIDDLECPEYKPDPYPPNDRRFKKVLQEAITTASVNSAQKLGWQSFEHMMASAPEDGTREYYFYIGAIGAAYHYSEESMVKYAGLNQGLISDEGMNMVRRGYTYGLTGGR